MTVIGIIGIIGTVEYAQAQTILEIPPLPNTPEPTNRAMAIASNPLKKDYWYTTSRPNLTASIEPQEDSLGHLFIPGPRQSILPNPILPKTHDEPSILCSGNTHNVKKILNNDYADSNVKGLTAPNNIMPKGNDSIIAAGINWYPSTENDNEKCLFKSKAIDLEAQSKHPLTLTKELRWTLYNQSDKKAYHFSPRENILEAQPIPLCTSTNLNTTDQTLLGDTKMCYGKHESNMVIITKKLTGFYGAAESITTPDDPIALDSNVIERNSYVELLKRLYLPAI